MSPGMSPGMSSVIARRDPGDGEAASGEQDRQPEDDHDAHSGCLFLWRCSRTTGSRRVVRRRLVVYRCAHRRDRLRPWLRPRPVLRLVTRW